MADQYLEDLVARLEQKFQQQAQETPLKVLVLGPSMTSREPEGRLRKHIHRKARSFGASVKGELKGLVDASKKHFGAGHNLCDYEILLADDMDAIVIIPSSPGSFAELGLFAHDNQICAKSLLLFSKEFRGSSFITLGPKRSYRQRGARVEVIDYSDVDAAWTAVKEFLQERRVLKIVETRRIGTAAR